MKGREEERVMLITEESALHSGSIGVAIKLVVGGESDLIIQGDGRWGSNAFMRYL